MTLVQTSPTHIYYGEPIIVSDMQGPCPDGFHIPLHTEWTTLAQILSTLGIANGIYAKSYLKMPYAGFRNDYTSNVQHLNEDGYYISSSSLTSEYIFFLKTEDVSFSDNNGTQIGTGCSIRPFANTPVTPDSSWTALYSDKIYHNSDLGLISISSDGNTRITIADKNLGATTVYNSGDTLSESNCGKYYQRGNNYGFPFTGTVTTSSTQVNASTYGPGNYYESSTFITTNPRDNSGNLNLRGGVSQGTSEKATDIKAVYLGTNQVRPKARNPGANTLVYYKFDNQTLLNSATGTVDATWHSGAGSYGTGYKGVGYAANIASGGAIDLTKHLPQGNFTLTFCMKLNSFPPGSGNLRGIFGNEGVVGGKNHIQFTSDGKFEYVQYATDWSPSPSVIDSNSLSLSANTWYVVSLVRSGNVVKIFIDGTLRKQGNDYNYNYTTQTATCWLGACYDATNRKLNGYLDSVIIENKAWTDSEVVDYYNLIK